MVSCYVRAVRLRLLASDEVKLARALVSGVLKGQGLGAEFDGLCKW